MPACSRGSPGSLDRVSDTAREDSPHARRAVPSPTAGGTAAGQEASDPRVEVRERAVVALLAVRVLA